MTPEPFRIDIPESVIEDLRARVRNAVLPDDPDNADWDYGFNADFLRQLMEQWAGDYDWRAAERAMNAYAHYRVTIDGVPVHFMHVPGRGPSPKPLILTHGWPWTFWDMHRVAGPLADPAAYGGNPADAFDVIVPSLPGFAFSTPLRAAGMNFWRTADIWHRLMTEVLGHSRYAAAGGDWGALVTSQLGHKYADSLYGIHLLHAIGLDLFNAERYWDVSSSFVPHDLPDAVRKPALAGVKKLVSHVAVQTVEPQTLAYAMHDSPVGLLAWIIMRRYSWGDVKGDLDSLYPREHLLTTATLYWVTRCFSWTARFYRDAVRYPWAPSHARTPRVEAPTGLSFMGGENPPGVTHENRAELFRAGPVAPLYNLHYVKAHPAGGHFGHYENPDACIEDIRATFRDLS